MSPYRKAASRHDIPAGPPAPWTAMTTAEKLAFGLPLIGARDDTRGLLTQILDAVTDRWRDIRWTLRIDDASDAYALCGCKDGMWATRYISGPVWVPDLITRKCFVAAGDIEAHLAQFDHKVKRLKWHAPRRAR